YRPIQKYRAVRRPVCQPERSGWQKSCPRLRVPLGGLINACNRRGEDHIEPAFLAGAYGSNQASCCEEVPRGSRLTGINRLSDRPRPVCAAIGNGLAEVCRTRLWRLNWKERKSVSWSPRSRRRLRRLARSWSLRTPV